MCILVKKLADMVGKQDKTPQLSIFDTPLERFINLEHELCVLNCIYLRYLKKIKTRVI